MVHWRAGCPVAPLSSFAVPHAARRRGGHAGAPGEAGRDGSGGARPLLPAAGEALTRITGRGPAFLNPEATRPVAQSIHRHRRARPPPCFRIPLCAMPPWLCCQGKKPIFSYTLPITSEKVIVPSSAHVSGLLEYQFTVVSLLERYFASPSLQVN